MSLSSTASVGLFSCSSYFATDSYLFGNEEKKQLEKCIRQEANELEKEADLQRRGSRGAKRFSGMVVLQSIYGMEVVEWKYID